MIPDDEGGGGAADAGGGGGAPAVKEIKLDALCSFTSLLERSPLQLLPGDEGGGGGCADFGDGGCAYFGDGGDGSTAATEMRDSEDLVCFNGLEFFMDSQPGHMLDTQLDIKMDWHQMEGDAHMEDIDSDCEFLVRCESDTDVEDCFPVEIKEAVEQVTSMAEIVKEVRVKDAKYKAEMTREAKRRAIEGVAEDDRLHLQHLHHHDAILLHPHHHHSASAILQDLHHHSAILQDLHHHSDNLHHLDQQHANFLLFVGWELQEVGVNQGRMPPPRQTLGCMATSHQVVMRNVPRKKCKRDSNGIVLPGDILSIICEVSHVSTSIM